MKNLYKREFYYSPKESILNIQKRVTQRKKQKKIKVTKEKIKMSSKDKT